AEYFFPGENPIGQQILRSPTDSNPPTIVGVAADVRFGGPATGPERELFMPEAQYPWGSNAIVVRGRGIPASLLPSVRAALRKVDPTIPLSNVAPMGDLLAEL